MSDVPEVLKPEYYFDLDSFEHRALFEGAAFVWDAVAKLQQKEYVEELARRKFEQSEAPVAPEPMAQGGQPIKIAEGAVIRPHVTFSGTGGILLDEGAEILPGTVIDAGEHYVYIGPGATVGPHAHLDARKGSIYVGAQAKLRQSCYLRELAVIGAGATVGNSTEVKTSVVGEQAEIPHFNYIGDSLLGFKAHTGAGVKISNLKITPGHIVVKIEGRKYETGLRKLGIIMGDRAQIGCNSVANPGTLLGPRSLVYTTTSIGGFIPADKIVKLRQTHEISDLKS